MIQAALAWFILTGHPDASLLKVFADSAHVPAKVVWALAEVESGHKADNLARGANGEIGRYQIKLDWSGSFIQECGKKPLTDYLTNICKGPRILRWCYDKTLNWREAIVCYNSGRDARQIYLPKVLAVLGRYQLTIIQQDGTYVHP